MLIYLINEGLLCVGFFVGGGIIMVSRSRLVFVFEMVVGEN